MWYMLIVLATHIPNLLETKENIENDQSINIYKKYKIKQNFIYLFKFIFFQIKYIIKNCL